MLPSPPPLLRFCARIVSGLLLCIAIALGGGLSRPGGALESLRYTLSASQAGGDGLLATPVAVPKAIDPAGRPDLATKRLPRPDGGPGPLPLLLLAAVLLIPPPRQTRPPRLSFPRSGPLPRPLPSGLCPTGPPSRG
ncbi:hypothetical protein RC1_0678 [Rhodospirillum centenum SW]|uniref:Uncharacterized protein n=1 Tax=Rhodospirillum centenum (strain ATCC 51521 / SW) TaxID=414684 RepID=B6IRM7_RHOCS|nr:hypothetical protein RC1_0678 [Rhodospirillum centenum SW]